MAKCDLCGCACNLIDMTEVPDIYQVDGIKNVCCDCRDWANKLLTDMLLETGPRMQSAIRKRAGLPNPPHLVPWWKSSFRKFCAAFMA